MQAPHTSGPLTRRPLSSWGADLRMMGEEQLSTPDWTPDWTGNVSEWAPPLPTNEAEEDGISLEQ